MSKKSLKRKAVVYADKLEVTLSDLEEDHNPVQVTVNKLSKDRQRIARQEYIVQAKVEPDPKSNIPEVDPAYYFIPDFAGLDVEAFQPEHKQLKDRSSRKKRYVSSVRHASPRVVASFHAHPPGLAAQELDPFT